MPGGHGRAHANSGEQGSYGIDAETAKVAELLKQAFETDALQSYPVATGTTANALAVASSTASFYQIVHVECMKRI